MKIEFRLVTAAVVATIVISTTIAQGGSRSHPLDEDAALDLLARTLKHDHVYAKRISLGCITYDTEETTDAYFQFALREKHDAKCGGDPEISPVVARYRVHRRSGKIEKWEAASDTWHAYKGAKTK
jgi:hypothetical protein